MNNDISLGDPLPKGATHIKCIKRGTVKFDYVDTVTNQTESRDTSSRVATIAYKIQRREAQWTQARLWTRAPEPRGRWQAEILSLANGKVFNSWENIFDYLWILIIMNKNSFAYKDRDKWILTCLWENMRGLYWSLALIPPIIVNERLMADSISWSNLMFLLFL